MDPGQIQTLKVMNSIHPHSHASYRMLRYMLLIVTLLGLQARGVAQSVQDEISPSRLRAGGAYFGENVLHPGLVLEFEYEKGYTPMFSLPLRTNLGYYWNRDYSAFFLDVHKGFRKYFRSGLFLEQSIGTGLILKSYGTEMWYMDEYFNSVPHGNKPVLGFMPSVTVGAGYDLSRDRDRSGLLWVRPKIYWDLGFRKLHQPYFALQLGYTHTFKTL
jgi:hypothetical protein